MELFTDNQHFYMKYKNRVKPIKYYILLPRNSSYNYDSTVSE